MLLSPADPKSDPNLRAASARSTDLAKPPKTQSAISAFLPKRPAPSAAPKRPARFAANSPAKKRRVYPGRSLSKSPAAKGTKENAIDLAEESDSSWSDPL